MDIDWLVLLFIVVAIVAGVNVYNKEHNDTVRYEACIKVAKDVKECK